MKSFFNSYKIPFSVLVLAAVFFSFNGFEFSGDRDADAIETENFMLSSADQMLRVVTPYNKVSDLNASVQLNRQFSFNSLFSVADTMTLAANPGPPNNGVTNIGAGQVMNLIGGSRDVYVTQLRTGSNSAAGAPVRFEIYIRDGNGLGGPLASGPASSMTGWTLIDTAEGVQGPSGTTGTSELITVGPIPVGANDTVGVVLRALTNGFRYFGTGTPPLENYVDTNVRLITGDVRSAVFTTTGTWFSSRALTGVIRYVVSTTTGITNLNLGIPDGYKLSQNYPNPFNPSTHIEFAIPEKTNVTLKVYNVSGQEVAVLANDQFNAGTYMVKWDAAGMASGVYFYTINTGNFTQTKKLLLVK